MTRGCRLANAGVTSAELTSKTPVPSVTKAEREGVRAVMEASTGLL
nr:hypothetical protein [Halomonas hydrothermalis]